MRGQSYAGHALADISVTGGSASFLVGISPLWGFVGVGVLAAGVMDMIGIRRPRGRDLATGIVRGAGLGPGRAVPVLGHHAHQHDRRDDHDPVRLHVHHQQLDPAGHRAVQRGRAGHRGRAVPPAAAQLGQQPTWPRCAGSAVRLVGALCLVAIALAVSLSAMTIGAILSTALLIGPAATALRLTSRPGLAMTCGGGHRAGRDLAGRAAGLRQLLLAAGAARLAGELLRGHPDLPRLPAGLPGSGAGAARRSRPGGRVWPAGDRCSPGSWSAPGRWRASSRSSPGWSASSSYCAGPRSWPTRVPQGAFAGAAGASLLGVNTLIGLGAFALLGALGIGWLGRRGRHDVATALALVVMLGLGALFLSFSVQYAPEIYSLLFGEVLGVSVDRDSAGGHPRARCASGRSCCSTGRCCSPR